MENKKKFEHIKKFKKIVIGSDHGAFLSKEHIKKFLMTHGLEVHDVGVFSADRSDYPIYAKQCVQKILEDQESLGVLMCGSGIGVSMVANRFQGIRAALCRSVREAELARQHNDANVLCLGERLQTFSEMEQILEAFFNTEFEGDRHTLRLNLFSEWGEKL